MRLYIKKLNGFNYESIRLYDLRKIFSQNETKFCYINKDFADNFFSPFEDTIADQSNSDENDKKFKKFFGIINFSNFETETLEFALFKVDNSEPNYFFRTNNIKIEELKDHVKSICLLKIINNFVVYGSLTNNNSASKNINIFISKLFSEEITCDYIPNFDILQEIENAGVSEIDFNIITNKNYSMSKNNTFINLIKSINNVLFDNSSDKSNQKNDLKLKISISGKNNRKNGYNGLEILKTEALNLMNEDDLENEYIIYLKNGNKIQSTQLILSKLINVDKKEDLKNVATHIFIEMANFFEERIRDINEVSHND